MYCGKEILVLALKGETRCLIDKSFAVPLSYAIPSGPESGSFK